MSEQLTDYERGHRDGRALNEMMRAQAERGERILRDRLEAAESSLSAARRELEEARERFQAAREAVLAKHKAEAELERVRGENERLGELGLQAFLVLRNVEPRTEDVATMLIELREGLPALSPSPDQDVQTRSG